MSCPLRVSQSCPALISPLAAFSRLLARRSSLPPASSLPLLTTSPGVVKLKLPLAIISPLLFSLCWLTGVISPRGRIWPSPPMRSARIVSDRPALTPPALLVSARPSPCSKRSSPADSSPWLLSTLPRLLMVSCRSASSVPRWLAMLSLVTLRFAASMPCCAPWVS